MADLTGVRSIGLFLEALDRTQVSMNLTLPTIGTIPKVFDFVAKTAQEVNCELHSSEIIGAIPLAYLEGVTPDAILWYDFMPTQIIENWISLPGETF